MKTQKTRRVLAVLLALILTVGLLPTPALAARMEEDEVVIAAPGEEPTGRPSGGEKAETLALLTHEKIKTLVYKAYSNGEIIDSTYGEGTCKDGSGHSGYIHSKDANELIRSTGYTGYKSVVHKRYSYWGSSTCGATSAHYNITGSAPYTTDESIWLIYDRPHTHSYSTFLYYSTQPTCYSNGTAVYSCSCGATTTQTVAKLSADYTGQSWVDQGDGTEKMVCRNCNGGASGHFKTRAATVQNVTLTYMDRGSLYAKESQAKGSTFTVKNCTSTRQGYTCLGWSGSSAATTADWEVGDTMKLTADATLYAVWQKEQVIITYNGNGNTGGSAPTAQTADKGTEITVRSRNGMTKTGCEFLGWSENKDATTADYEPGEGVTPNASMTLYAVWKNTATASYTVEWFDTLGNRLRSPETRGGAVGGTVSATADDKYRTVDGYFYEADGSTDSATLAASGTKLVLKFKPLQPSNQYLYGLGSAMQQMVCKDAARHKEVYPIAPETNGNNWLWVTRSGVAVVDGKYQATVTIDGEKMLKEMYAANFDKSKHTLCGGQEKTATLTFTWNVEDQAWETNVELPVTFYIEGTKTTYIWMNEGVKVDEQTVSDCLTAPDYSGTSPTKAEDEDYTYAFREWSGPATDDDGNKVYTAVYTATPKPATHTVTWVDEDGATVLDGPKTFQEGEAEPAFGKGTPTKASDATYHYAFKAWVKTVDNGGNILYTASYDATRKSTGGGGGGGGSRPVDPPEEDLDDEEVPLADLPMLNQADHFAYIIGKPDGNVHPMGNITRAEVVTIFFRIMTEEARAANWGETSGFSDVTEGMWYNHAVCAAVNAGLVKGLPDGTFGGDRNITRAEFATIAARFLDTAAQPAEKFTDIEGHWAEADINRATVAGWIKGVGDGKFNPDDHITRAEVMTLVNRMLNRKFDAANTLADMTVWPDNLDKNAWYYGDVQEATNDHAYDRKAGTLTESWTKITESRDWSGLEK